MSTHKPKNIDEYIAAFPEEKQFLLKQIRETVRKAAPEAIEVISYEMPAFKQNGILVYFAAYKKHIGFYPTASGIEAFRTELSAYKTSNGTIRFLISKPLPLNLISMIVEYMVELNKQKSDIKKKKHI